jgi:hypothetical protein
MSEILNLFLTVAVLHSPVNDHPLYIDPGSGSFIFQLIIATLLGAAFIVKAYWKRIRTAISKIFHRSSDSSGE